MILASAIVCLAANIYYEARGETPTGQLAVAAVTLNRAHGDKSQICKVVTAPAQFSWTIGRLHKFHNHYFIPKKYAPKDIAAWIQSWEVAKTALRYSPAGIVHGATFYHTIDVNPAWDKSMEVVAQIGNHIFYKPLPQSLLTAGGKQWNHTASFQTASLAPSQVLTTRASTPRPIPNHFERAFVAGVLFVFALFMMSFSYV